MKKILRRAGYLLLPILIVLFIAIQHWEAITYFTLRKAALFYAGREGIILDMGAISGSPLSNIKVDREGPYTFTVFSRRI